jgi:hypothetical protein
MGYRLLGLGVVLALAAACPAQDQMGWAHKLLAVDGKPVVEHDFGTAAKGTQLQHRFPITNIYGVPLQLQARVSCDCTNVTLSRQTLQPKEAGYLDVVMDTRRFSGPKVVTIFLTVAHPQYTSTAVFNVKAVCRTDVTLNPGSINFGIVPRGQGVTAAVDVDYAGVLNWQITGVPASDLFRIDVTERYRQPGRVGYRVQLSLKPDAPAGSYKQELLLATNDPASPTVPVPFELTVQSPLAVLPEVVRFPSARVGASTEYKISVRGSGKPFRITAVDGLGDGLSLVEVVPSIESRPVHILTLRYAPSAGGSLNRKVTFMTDAGMTATVAVEGAAAAQ